MALLKKWHALAFAIDVYSNCLRHDPPIFADPFILENALYMIGNPPLSGSLGSAKNPAYLSRRRGGGRFRFGGRFHGSRNLSKTLHRSPGDNLWGDKLVTAFTEMALVPFHAHQIMTVRAGGIILVVMKPIVDALGLEWSAQWRRVQRHPVLSKGIAMMAIPSLGGIQEAVTLPLKDFYGWLLTLDTTRIRNERYRDLIIRYQEESFHAIHDYWHKGRADNPRVSSFNSRAPLLALRLMKELKQERNSAVRRSIHAMLARTCEEVGVEAPSLGDIGRNAPTPPDILAPFFAGLETLTEKGVAFDHARDPDLLAINLKEIATLFERNGVNVKIKATLRQALKECAHPAFVTRKAVNSAVDRSTKCCWVFRRT